MRVNNNEITVHRNETFTIDKTILAKDGAPFIVSSELRNPYICITVASSRYEQSGRYKHTWWLDQALGYNDDGELIVPLNRFRSTTPIHLDSNDWSTPLPIDPNTGERYAANEALWYIILPNGTKDYRRWDVASGKWVKYEFRIIKTFTHEHTRDWLEQEYLYSITLVSGNSTLDYINELKLHTFMRINNIIDSAIFLDILDEKYDIDLVYEWNKIPNDVIGIYKWLREIDRSLVKDIDITAPLVSYDSVQIILPPTKLTVQSYLKGGL